MVNQSKKKDLRFWKKWEANGSVATIEDSLIRSYAKDPRNLNIDAIGTHLSGPAKGMSTLSLGQVPNQSGYSPLFYVVVPTKNFKLGGMLKKLPKGYRTRDSVFGTRKYF